MGQVRTSLEWELKLEHPKREVRFRAKTTTYLSTVQNRMNCLCRIAFPKRQPMVRLLHFGLPLFRTPEWGPPSTWLWHKSNFQWYLGSFTWVPIFDKKEVCLA